MLQENLSHFSCCQTIIEQFSTAVFPCAQFAEKRSIGYLVLTSHSELPTLKPKKAGLNCSAIHA